MLFNYYKDKKNKYKNKIYLCIYETFDYVDIKHIVSFYFSNYNTQFITNIYSMFNGCSSLANVNLSNLNTSNVSTMNYMFNNCINLRNINLSNFNTDKLKYMAGMFYNCNN